MGNSAVLVSGAVICYVNGIRCGKVTSFRWSSETPRKEIFCLDQNIPVEEAPTTARCSGSLGLIRLVHDGGLEGIGVIAHSSQVERERYFTIMIVDRISNSILFRADSCSATAQSWDIPSRGLVSGTLNFSCLSWSNEVIPFEG